MKHRKPINILKAQTRAFQDSLPTSIKFRNSDKQLTDKEMGAARRASWYIVEKGYGLGTAVARASGSYGCSPTTVERTVRPVFPDGYFEYYEAAKNKIMVKNLALGNRK